MIKELASNYKRRQRAKNVRSQSTSNSAKNIKKQPNHTQVNSSKENDFNFTKITKKKDIKDDFIEEFFKRNFTHEKPSERRYNSMSNKEMNSKLRRNKRTIQTKADTPASTMSKDISNCSLSNIEKNTSKSGNYIINEYDRMNIKEEIDDKASNKEETGIKKKENKGNNKSRQKKRAITKEYEYTFNLNQKSESIHIPSKNNTQLKPKSPWKKIQNRKPYNSK